MALRGNLKDFSLPDVFQLISYSRKSGVLRLVRADGIEGSVWFRDGDVFFARSDWHTELLGERLVVAGRITPAALERGLELRRAEPDGGRRLGTILVDEGYLTESVLEVFVQEQIQDTIFDLMRWDAADFDFEILPEVAEEDIGLTVSLENIVMEGARRLEEWERIRARIPSMDVVFKMAEAPGEGSFEISLKPVEWSLLLLVDGTRSVTELARSSNRNEFEVARVLYGLLSAGLLEVVDDEEVARRNERRERRAERATASPRPAGPRPVAEFGRRRDDSMVPGPVLSLEAAIVTPFEPAVTEPPDSAPVEPGVPETVPAPESDVLVDEATLKASAEAPLPFAATDQSGPALDSVFDALLEPAEEPALAEGEELAPSRDEAAADYVPAEDPGFIREHPTEAATASDLSAFEEMIAAVLDAPEASVAAVEPRTEGELPPSVSAQPAPVEGFDAADAAGLLGLEPVEEPPAAEPKAAEPVVESPAVESPAVEPSAVESEPADVVLEAPPTPTDVRPEPSAPPALPAPVEIPSPEPETVSPTTAAAEAEAPVPAETVPADDVEFDIAGILADLDEIEAGPDSAPAAEPIPTPEPTLAPRPAPSVHDVDESDLLGGPGPSPLAFDELASSLVPPRELGQPERVADVSEPPVRQPVPAPSPAPEHGGGPIAGVDLGFGVELTDELSALTGAARPQARPAARMTKRPAGTSPLKRDSAIDKSTLSQIIDGIQNL